MNRRERILALTALAVVILVGGGFLFKFLFLDALASINTQIADANQDVQKKQEELNKQSQEEQAMERRDPRLLLWQRLSLPDDKNLEQEVKNGATADDARKRHEDLIQVQYQQFLTDLMRQSGFTQNTLKVSSAPSDRKGGPMLTGKTPAYTKMSFTIQGQARLDAVERMLQGFYSTPLLHEVRNLTLTSRQANRTTQPAGPGGAAPGGFAAAPGGFPAAAPGGFPGGAPGGFPAAAPGGFPAAAPGGFPGRPGGFAAGQRGAAAGGGDLDVSMTVEALMVTGAEKRDSLLPDGKDVPPHELAEPGRQYSDLLAKNMFTGVAADAKLTEDPAQVLAAVKLTTIWNSGRRWQASIYDQGKGGDEMRLKPPILDEFSVADKYSNVIVRGKVVHLDEDGMIFQANDKYYRWRCGEFLGPVMQTPLGDSELKELGVKVAAAGN